MRRPVTALLLVVFSLPLAGCREQLDAPTPPPRPVTFVTLDTEPPPPTSRLTGSAESWKREDLGFEVAGRVLAVVEPGANILGRTFDEQGEMLTEGTILAEVDKERYQIALDQAQAAADAVKTELEQVIPQQLEQAQANLQLQLKELERYTALVAQQSASKQELDRVESAFRAAKARVAEVEALRATKGAQLNTFQAQVDQAQVNIRDCTLFSPFNGQVARVNIIPGGYVLPGQPVVTVQMMDPMKVDIAVSPETDARVNYNDLVRVFTPNGDQLEGFVYLKDTFADPGTRTFLITLLVRNRRIEIGVPEEFQGQAVARCRHLWKLDKPEVGGSGNYYAETGAIQQDDEGHFVWKVDKLTVPQLYGDFDPVLTVRKVRVELGEGRVPVLQVFTFRELKRIVGDLEPDRDVIASKISGDVQDGGTVVLVRQRWAVRPGDVVRVDLKGAEPPEGLYVPEDAIQSDGQQNYVAVVQEAADGTEKVQFVAVYPRETVGRLQRIEAVADGGLQAGMKVIVAGAHYVRDGESVRTVDEVQASP
jgi:multidrug efflux pump subunit AcrA (membrane-fusion protein)